MHPQTYLCDYCRRARHARNRKIKEYNEYNSHNNYNLNWHDISQLPNVAAIISYAILRYSMLHNNENLPNHQIEPKVIVATAWRSQEAITYQ